MGDLDDEYVFRDITQFDGVWRPKSSLSVPESLAKNSDSRPVTGKSRVEYQFKRDEDSSYRKNRAATGKYSTASAPTPAPANSQIVFVQNKRFSRTAPTQRNAGKFNGYLNNREQNMAKEEKGFHTLNDRKKATNLTIQYSARTRASFPQPDRTCHAYSAYNVARACERLAISPYGEPMLSGATGRYREKYKAKMAAKSPQKKVRTPRASSHPSRLVEDGSAFERFFENSIMRNILDSRVPAGVLKKPPPRPHADMSRSTDSIVSKIHKNAQRRVTAVQSTLGLGAALATEGQRWGAEHQVALLLSARLEQHRRSSSQSDLDTLEFMSVKNDVPRFKSQPASLLTKGENSLREGIQSNAFDESRTKRGPIQFFHQRRRSRSPPLSKMSRDQFLPEALMRRQDQDSQLQSSSDMRIAKPGMTTPVSDWRSGVSESTRRPKSTLTTKMRLESVASISNEILANEEDKEIAQNNDNVVNIDNINIENGEEGKDDAVEEILDADEGGYDSDEKELENLIDEPKDNEEDADEFIMSNTDDDKELIQEEKIGVRSIETEVFIDNDVRLVMDSLLQEVEGATLQ